MGKNGDIDPLTNIMSKALRHKIGSIVNENEFYAEKYAKDAENIMNEAERIAERQNWNRDDKAVIKEKLRKKLHKELEEKDFIDNRKFSLMDEEIAKALEAFNLL